MDVSTGVVIGMVIVAFFAILGGMKGITWTQVAQYCVLITAYLIPAIAISLILTGSFLPQWGFSAGDIVSRLDNLQTDLGFARYTDPFVHKPAIDILFTTIALMVGTAGLPHVIVRFYTVPTVRAARYSAMWALLFIAILYTTAPALAAFSRYNLIRTLHDQPITAVQRLDWVRKWETPAC